jgi:hypothetical protein
MASRRAMVILFVILSETKLGARDNTWKVGGKAAGEQMW